MRIAPILMLWEIVLKIPPRQAAGTLAAIKRQQPKEHLEAKELYPLRHS
jgi:hypothetical protein